MLLSAGADERLCVINTENTEEFETVATYRKKFGQIQHMVSMASSGYEPDEGKLIASSSDKNIRIIDLNENGQIISKIPNKDGPINYLKIHSSSNFLLMADTSNKVKLWDIRTGDNVSTFHEQMNNISCIEHLDNDAFLTSSRNGLISIWDYRMTDKCLKSNVIQEKELPDEDE